MSGVVVQIFNPSTPEIEALGSLNSRTDTAVALLCVVSCRPKQFLKAQCGPLPRAPPLPVSTGQIHHGGLDRLPS